MFKPTMMADTFRAVEMRSMISNEAEDVSGRTGAEIERVIYARVPNFQFLERATGASRQEQWSVKVEKTEDNAGSGSIRVRKVTNLREPGAAVQYILTSKLDIGKGNSCAETSEQSTVDQFNVFRYMAGKGMLKDRYTFSIEGSDLMWEVDCFPKPGQMYFEWVKIDLEKWPSNKELPQLPFAISEMMDGDKSHQSEETAAKIKRLYDEVFLLPNTMNPLADYDDEGHGQPGVAVDKNLTQGMNPEGKNDDETITKADQTDATGQDDDAGNASADGSGDATDAGKEKGDQTTPAKPAGKAEQGDDDSGSDDQAGSDKSTS